MSQESDLVSTTDCLEAIGVLKSWKNLFFIVMMICLLLLQISFWVVDAGIVEPNGGGTQMAGGCGILPCEDQPQAQPQVAPVQTQNDAPKTDQDKKAVKTVQLKFEYVAWLIKTADFLLIFSLLMYSLTLLFGLKISLIGRLGGINHITRAFFLSFVVLVLVLPWQFLFGPVFTGWAYTSNELVNAKAWIKSHGSILNIALYYARFGALWVLVIAVAVFAQLRSIRWAKATMRRLGVV